MNRSPLLIAVTVATFSLPSLNAATIIADELGYAISGQESNSFGGDFSGDAFWGAGSQRSSNGFQNNHRSGRLFAEFVLTQAMITEANAPGASVSLTFTVSSIGQGVAGTPYTDGLDLRYFGIGSANPDVGTLWGTPGVVGDQADVLLTSGSAGTFTVTITNASVLTGIQTATAGQRISFGLLNSLGTNFTAPVGNSAAETYAFAMDHTSANYSLNVVPEPSSAILMSLGVLGLAARRRR